MLLVFVTAQAMSVSCSKDDDDNGSSSFNNQQVTISDDGKASNGGVFSSLDDKTFYLDYIKYEVEEGHLVVSGYDKTGFNGVAKIVARITYKSNSYEVLEIDREAFSGCNKLTSVSIPNSVTSIGYNAFRGCSGLTSIRVEKGNQNYDSRDNCNAIIETSTNTLIAGCSKTIIPNSVTSIGSSAFYGCSELTSIIIPNSVTSIEYFAFYGCTGLKYIHCLSSIPPKTRWIDNNGTDYSAFSFDTYQNATLYVPKGSIETYKATFGWEPFKNIVEE